MPGSSQSDQSRTGAPVPGWGLRLVGRIGRGRGFGHGPSLWPPTTVAASRRVSGRLGGRPAGWSELVGARLRYQHPFNLRAINW